MDVLSTVTRVVVVNPHGQMGQREYFADAWLVSVEDDGRTLKLFATGDGAEPQKERNRALAQEFERLHRADVGDRIITE